ncbi:MAG: type II secretion system F family protein, partial [Actinomycetia bacterium]|nr:type II secretion system F family protein [Actinomycetes bacterium]
MADTATFEYQVRDKGGKVVKGKIDAESPAAVANRLKSMGYAPISIEESGTGLNRDINIPGLGEKIKLYDIAVLCRQFATMINSGLTLLRALSILEDQTTNKALAKIIGVVRSRVEGGSSLSAALGEHEDVFPPLMINMVRAGEVGGFLDEVLLQIATNFEAEVRLRQKVKSAMTYPVMVFVMAILALTAMLLFIVPTFEGLFSQLGGELPLPT